eukprot:GILK01005313.1.p1 GENE.GILK01005313.1~~GILK01005313.1.p1  ORF type:complete len:438 (-),score=68.48 GILK01005313.1:104-1369(-)
MSIRLLVVGAGSRGKVYSTYAAEHPELVTVVGVAEPSTFHRNFMASKYNIPEENIFMDWKEAAARERFAEAVLLTTPDAIHAEPAVAFANKGYHILLEKPMAVTEKECVDIVTAVEKNDVILAVGHVLRYTPYSKKIKEIMDSGMLGDVLSIQHLEPVGWYHYAHSYVRGNWRKESESTFMLMAKSCHDIDLLRYYMGRPIQYVSSFGSLQHFKSENKPLGASDNGRCDDCSIEPSCPYSALKIYMEPFVTVGHVGWPVKIVCPEPSVESITEALRTGPYGRCVYQSDNDVVDHQVVNMQFEGGATASFTMVATTKEICVRKTNIYGSKGQLECDGYAIKHFDFNTKQETVIRPQGAPVSTKMQGHQGADFFLMDSFVKAVITGDRSHILSGPRETLESHLSVFCAERARKEMSVVKIPNQ